MGKIAITSGGSGDVIISIPVMKRLGITTLYVKESFYPDGYGSMYSALKPLLELNGFTVLPTKDEGKGFDQFEAGVKYHINMDAWRGIPGRGRDYIGHSMAMWFKCGRPDFTRPWLTIDDVPTGLTGQDYTLWFLSPRWRQSDVNWAEVYQKVKGYKYFVGFWEDYVEFKRIAVPLIHNDFGYIHSDNFLLTARLIRDAKAVYCNQSPILAICQGMGKEYYCAFKNGKTNCYTYTKNEHPI